jgi:hypothetical protein
VCGCYGHTTGNTLTHCLGTATACQPYCIANYTDADCRDCAAGYYGVYQTTCNICPLGRYSLANSTTCTACPAGKYAATLGTSSCSLCPAGRYSDVTGATACPCCPRGTFSASPGANHCSSSACGDLCHCYIPPVVQYGGPSGPTCSTSAAQCAGDCTYNCAD